MTTAGGLAHDASPVAAREESQRAADRDLLRWLWKPARKLLKPRRPCAAGVVLGRQSNALVTSHRAVDPRLGMTNGGPRLIMRY